MDRLIVTARRALVGYIVFQLVNEIYKQGKQLEKQDKYISYLSTVQKIVVTDHINHGLLTADAKEAVLKAGTDLKFEELTKEL